MNPPKAKAIGINHVSIEVTDIPEAMAFYDAFLDGEWEDVGDDRASLEMGDQFLAFTLRPQNKEINDQHFGLVVDDAAAAREALEAAGANILPGRFLRILDPFDNLIEVVDYKNVRFSKTAEVLERLDRPSLAKNEKGRAALEGMHASKPSGRT